MESGMNGSRLLFPGALLSFLALVLAMTLAPDLLATRLGGTGMTLAMLLGLFEMLFVVALALLHVRAVNRAEGAGR